jgi:competence protein ComEC
VRVRGLWRASASGGDYVLAAELAASPREHGPRGWAWRALGGLEQRRELGEALILGQGDPPEKPEFRASGLIHVLAVSGMHLVIAAAFGTWLLALLGVGWWPRLAALAIFIAGYTWLTGGSPATQRALAMGLAITAMAMLAREPHRLAAVSLAALALLAWDPGNATDFGFQLSLAAVVGILTLGRDLIACRERWLPLAPWPLDRPVWRGALWGARAGVDGLAIGLAAGLATVPLLAFKNGTINTWGPVATLLATPPATVALWLGLPLIVLAGVWPTGPWEGFYRLVEFGLDALARIAHWSATWPGAVVEVGQPPAVALLLWPLLFLPLEGPWAAVRRLGVLAALTVLWRYG